MRMTLGSWIAAALIGLTSADAQDLLAPGPARRFRTTILAPGGAKPAEALVRDFLGRPYRFDAWAAWLNTATPAPTAP